MRSQKVDEKGYVIHSVAAANSWKKCQSRRPKGPKPEFSTTGTTATTTVYILESRKSGPLTFQDWASPENSLSNDDASGTTQRRVDGQNVVTGGTIRRLEILVCTGLYEFILRFLPTGE